jgi:hypothetical protein
MRTLVAPLLAAVLAAAATAAVALGAGQGPEGRPGPDAGRAHAVGLWGDVPYSDEQRTRGVPNLIADVNRHALAFTVHAGDIKAGGARCDDAVYTQFAALLGTLRAPAMYTPGDNEWTDCDRPAAGGFDSEERLAFLRRTLFADAFSSGQRKLPLEQQAAPYVENRRWHVGAVTYATLHVVGSDDNLGDVAPDPEEWAARSAATIRWLRATFAAAADRRAAGVMLVAQANPGFDESDPTRAPVRDPRTLLGPDGPDGFTAFLRALREETIAFGRPVVLVHGDSHVFRIDKPLLDAEGRRIQHLTRLETPGDHAQSGSNDVQWVRAVADPRDPEVFSFEHEVVPANLPEAYTP